MRVLVAGSVGWPKPTVVHDALGVCADAARRRGEQLTIVFGHDVACRTRACSGAEHDTHLWTEWAMVRAMGVAEPEHYPIVWTGPCRPRSANGRRGCGQSHRRTNTYGETTCPSAGFYRNETMVDSGADLWLAFAYGEDRGVAHLVDTAIRAGIDGQPFELAPAWDAVSASL